MNIIVKGSKQNLNVIDKNCIKGTINLEYIDVDNAEVFFEIYDDNGVLIGNMDAALADNKAGMQIVRLRTSNKSLDEQEQMVKAVIANTFDPHIINHYVLAIHIIADGSGIDYSILEHLGFVGFTDIGSEYYTLLNPDYINLVQTLATSEEATYELSKYYNRQQIKKERQAKRLADSLRIAQGALKDESITSFETRARFQNECNYCQECINALGSFDPMDLGVKR